MKIIRDFWLCPDCVPVAVNGDYSHLDYGYNEPEASHKARVIDAGLDALPGLVPDFTSEPERECCECGHIGCASDFPDDTTEEEEPESYFRCPKCDSWDTRERDSGELEFSRIDCDCCGTDLDGSRFRFAQLIQEEEE